MELDRLEAGVRAADPRALARAITLVESRREDHRGQATELLDRLAGHGHEALRIALSGTPGVGKSTFVEAFGCWLTGQGKRIAVLTIDPSSARSGGSILGDKTRMPRLSRDPDAFVRASPSQTLPGGVARRTRDAVALLEAAGFDVVLIETVGVGQSEIDAAGMTDVFLLLVAPGGGDELQGVKRGIMEMADVVAVNKADGALLDAARTTAADYSGALRLFRRGGDEAPGYPRVVTLSALEGTGLERVWEALDTLARYRRDSGAWRDRRRAQAERWFRDEVRAGLIEKLEADPAASDAMARLSAAVRDGERTPASAAAEVLRALGG